MNNGLDDLISECYEKLDLEGKEPLEFNKDFLLEEYYFYLQTCK